jgi:hypothetical protein
MAIIDGEDLSPELQQLLGQQFCFYCARPVTVSYVSEKVVFNNSKNFQPRPEIMNPDGTRHSCLARAAVKGDWH